MTWRQIKKNIHNSTGSTDLILLQFNSTMDSDNVSCYCANINFTRALEARTTNTPFTFKEGKKPMDLECFFTGFPLPLQVHWYKNDKVITNGTEGIYHTENKRPKNGEETLRSRLSLPPGREELEGVYNCRANNSIPGWQSEVSEELQLIYECPKPKGPTIDSDSEVLVKTFSTVILTCLSDVRYYCPTQLIWHNNTGPVERSKKYQIEQKTMRSKCKLQSILSIFNVTEDDEGNYSCYWDCDSRVAAIHLATFIQSHTGIGLFKQRNDRAEMRFFFRPNLCLPLTLNPDLTIDHANLRRPGWVSGHFAKYVLDSNALVHTLSAYSIAAYHLGDI